MGQHALEAQQRRHPADDAARAAISTRRPRPEGPEILRIVVGHSLLVRTPSRIKRILTGNPAVLESVVTSPNEVVLTAKQTGGSSLVLWEKTARAG